MMNFGKRKWLYVVAIAVGGWLVMQHQLSASRAAYDAGDLSAMAWTGFLPFFFPLFWGGAAVVVLAVAAFIELAIWIASRGE